jgi:hypothetical protein
VLPVAHLFTPGDGIGVADKPCPFPTPGWTIVGLDTRAELFVPNIFIPTFIVGRLPPASFDAKFRFLSLQYYTNTLLDKISRRPLQ